MNAPEAGIIKEFLVNEEDTVTVGQDIVRLEPGAAPEGGAESSAPAESSEPAQQKSQEPAPEKKAEPESKPEPRQEQASAPPAPQAPKETPAPKQPSQPAKDTSSSTSAVGNREERRVSPSSPNILHAIYDTNTNTNNDAKVKMNRMRLRIAERLKQSQNTAASLTTFQEVDMSALMEFRKLYKDDVLKKTGVKLGFMSAFARACVLAMRDIPVVNASIEGPNGGDTIVYRDYVDISVAVATEKGLVTPVVRNVEELDMIGIEKAIADMGKKVCDSGRLLGNSTASGPQQY